MTPELRLALQAYESVCRQERQLEQSRNRLQAAVVSVKEDELPEYVRLTQDLENRYSGYTVTPR